MLDKVFALPNGVSASRTTSNQDVKEELRALYEKEGAAIFRYCFSRSRNDDMAREAVQESFSRYLSARRAGVVIDKPAAWLLRVARNYVIDRQRGQAAASAAEDAVMVAAPGDPESEYRLVEERARLEAWLEQVLTPRERECVRMRWAGLAYHEIAATLGIEVGTVSSLLTRAVVKMRRSDCAERQREES